MSRNLLMQFKKTKEILYIVKKNLKNSQLQKTWINKAHLKSNTLNIVIKFFKPFQAMNLFMLISIPNAYYTTYTCM